MADSPPHIVFREGRQGKRVRLTLGQKIDAARKLQTGFHPRLIAQEYGCSLRLAKKLKSEAQRYLALDGADTRLDSKSIRIPRFSVIEPKLLDFAVFLRAAKRPISPMILKGQALLLKEKLLAINGLPQDRRAALQAFTASDGWATAFMQRHGLRPIVAHGQAGIVDVGEVASEIAKLRQELSEYSMDCIYHVDETALFYKLLPRRTYITSNDNRTTVRGTKNMKAEDKITAYLCANAEGSCKLPIVIIGNAKVPKLFEKKTPTVSYFHQKGAWSDTVTFRKWFYEVFMPFVRQRTSEKVALLLNNCGPHGTDLRDDKGQVSIFTLPPNIGDVHEPMNCGIIATWKVNYRHKLLTEMGLPDRSVRRNNSEHLKAATRGLAEGHDPDLLDVAELVSSAWDTVSEERIGRCWMQADILPPALQMTLRASYRKKMDARALRNDPMLRDLANLFERLAMHTPSEDPLVAELAGVSKKDVMRWAGIEEDEDIQTALLNDLKEDLSLEDVVSHPTERNNVADVSSDDEPAIPVPRPAQISACFKSLEEVALGTGTMDCFLHLRKAKRALMDAYDRQTQGQQS